MAFNSFTYKLLFFHVVVQWNLTNALLHIAPSD